jgi:hypothetical protein
MNSLGQPSSGRWPDRGSPGWLGDPRAADVRGKDSFVINIARNRHMIGPCRRRLGVLASLAANLGRGDIVRFNINILVNGEKSQ